MGGTSFPNAYAWASVQSARRRRTNDAKIAPDTQADTAYMRCQEPLQSYDIFLPSQFSNWEIMYPSGTHLAGVWLPRAKARGFWQLCPSGTSASSGVSRARCASMGMIIPASGRGAKEYTASLYAQCGEEYNASSTHYTPLRSTHSRCAHNAELRRSYTLKQTFVSAKNH